MSTKTITLDLNQPRRMYFWCVCSHSCGTSELVKLHLMENYCYLILDCRMHSDVLIVKVRVPGIQHNSSLNSVYWKIFSFKSCESVRGLVICLDRMNCDILYYQKSCISGVVWCILTTLLSLCQCAYAIIGNQNVICYGRNVKLIIDMEFPIIYTVNYKPMPFFSTVILVLLDRIF